jgi:hypothetical protein
MIIRYHLTNGSTLDEEVTFGATEQDVTVALANTLLEQAKLPGGASIVHPIPLITIRVITKNSKDERVRDRLTMIYTAQITYAELVLSELEERREVGAEGVN